MEPTPNLTTRAAVVNGGRADVLRHVVVDKVSLAEKFATFDDAWSPRIVGELNGQYVKLAKLRGEFVWHAHDAEDEMFFVVEGELEMHLEDRVETLRPGELFIVPRGVRHKPVAPRGEARVMLFEPKTTLNTGDAEDARTVKELPWA